MKGVVIVDTNLVVLLVVGTASKDYISKHKRLTSFSRDDFDLLVILLSQFSDIVTVPHILSEVSSIARHIENPARDKIQGALRDFIESCTEIPIQSIDGARRTEFHRFGITDAVILHVCAMATGGATPTLLTADTKLANAAHSLGYSVIDYRQQFQSDSRA